MRRLATTGAPQLPALPAILEHFAARVIRERKQNNPDR